jgi:hypothetical protein
MPGPLPGVKYFPAAPYNWGGGYFGLDGGYAFGTSDWTLGGVSSGSFSTNGFLFGGTLGANFHTATALQPVMVTVLRLLERRFSLLKESIGGVPPPVAGPPARA